MFLLILTGIPLLSLIWLGWVMRTRALRGAGRGGRVGVIVATGVLLAGYLWIVLARMGVVSSDAPSWLQAAVLLWGLMFLPLVAFPSLLVGSGLQVAEGLRRWRKVKKGAPKEIEPALSGRRQFLKTTALALPLIGTYGATAISIPQMRKYRVRRLTVALPGLPRDLDGVTVAHVSDVHVGKFTYGSLLTELAEETNRQQADLVLMTGDLIDHALADLPEALAMVKRIDPRSGLFMVEGNHDLFEGREEFAAGVEAAGVPLLRNQVARFELRGQPVDLLGTVWTHDEDAMARDIEAVSALRERDAFPILLAHHPHAFDPAAKSGIPLTLGGHTHGGQVMLTPDLGPGPLMYRYWSGLYQKPSGHAAVISNGAGNWFPLRTAAPAEIVHLTLKRA